MSLAMMKRGELVERAKLIANVAIYPALVGGTELWGVQVISWKEQPELPDFDGDDQDVALLCTAKGDTRYFKSIDSAFRQVRLFYGGTIDLD